MPLLRLASASQSHDVEYPGYLCGAEPPTPIAFAMRLGPEIINPPAPHGIA